ncbi:MAG TPA: oligosaccharide flippase family protein [Anaerolineales bacterium]|nr:oligosaccharide flippase family protein [Anaerolineales bacterium]
MSLLKKLSQDELFGRVIRSSAHLFSNNSISLLLSLLQGVLAARLLGSAGYGLIGIVMGYASTVNGLLSFRMSELVVRYGGEYLEKGDKQKAAALIKAASLTETIVSVLAFVFVALTAGLASHFIAKTPDTERLFIAYSLGLLANFNAETSTGILQITEKVKVRGTINLIQSLVSALIIGTAFLLHGSLVIVLLAYLVGKAIFGIGLFISAQIQLHRILGSSWMKASLSLLPSTRELSRFAFSSNLSATAILIFRESEILWVGYFLNTEAAGLYRIAYTIIGFLSVPADPLILTTYPELNRLVVQKAWPRLRDFLRKITALSFAYNMLIALGLVVFGRWILSVYGNEYVEAYPALMVLLAGLAFNYILFWNRPLLLSFGSPTFPLVATLIAGLIKVGLSLPLVPRYGYVMEAALLSFYYIFSVGLIVWRGMVELRKQESLA